jgi:hypothetical protein
VHIGETEATIRTPPAIIALLIISPRETELCPIVDASHPIIIDARLPRLLIDPIAIQEGIPTALELTPRTAPIPTPGIPIVAFLPRLLESVPTDR